ncbi:uncharacterized protein THITE_2010931, partial [Thermothielavioides terrestris NRRL 8126]
SLNARALAAWETNAANWDVAITQHGNKYWKRLQEPSLSRLLGARLASSSSSSSQSGSGSDGGDSGGKGCRALDLATGNGLCARWLLAKGAGFVLATDATAEMLRIARGYHDRASAERGAGGEGEGGEAKMRFRRVDVTSEADLAALAAEEGRFDVVLMNMALMDVTDLDPLARALPGLLADGGVFAATLLHPMFFTSGAASILNVRHDPVSGRRVVVRSKLVTEYMSVAPAMDFAVPGQPEKQAGLVMDAMEELAFTEADAEDRIESSANFTQLPTILSFRMRM